MAVGWSLLTITPTDEAVQQLIESWAWLLPEPFKPLLFSALGDVFFQSNSGNVFWLNTGTAEVTQVADSPTHFRELLGTEVVAQWFLPPLIERLRNAGKLLGPGQCYTYVTLPVFAEGKYEVDNLNPVPAHEHFALTGQVLSQIQSLPNGAKVRLSVGP
jgi:hypothetical protein